MQLISQPKDLINFPITNLYSNLLPLEGKGLIPSNKEAIKPPVRRSPRQTRKPEWSMVHEALVFDLQELMAEVDVRDLDTMYYHKAM